MMTLLEAISPTARGLLNQGNSGGGYREFDPEKHEARIASGARGRAAAGGLQAVVRGREFGAERAVAGNDPGTGLQTLPGDPCPAPGQTTNTGDEQ